MILSFFFLSFFSYMNVMCIGLNNSQKGLKIYGIFIERSNIIGAQNGNRGKVQLSLID